MRSPSPSGAKKTGQAISINSRAVHIINCGQTPRPPTWIVRSRPGKGPGSRSGIWRAGLAGDDHASGSAPEARNQRNLPRPCARGIYGATTASFSGSQASDLRWVHCTARGGRRVSLHARRRWSGRRSRSASGDPVISSVVKVLTRTLADRSGNYRPVPLASETKRKSYQ